MEALVIFGILFLLMFLGIPIGFSIGLTCISYIEIFKVVDLIQLPTKMYTSNDSYVFLAIPLFVFAGYLMEFGGISKRLVDFVYKLFGRIPGALGSVAVVACMIFAALTGSGVATVAAIGSVVYPLMIENGYKKEFAAGLIAASGALGPIIPPSIPMVIYGATMGVSVADLFLGGLLPGILLGVFFIVVNTVYAIIKKIPRNTNKYSAKEILLSFWRSLGILFLPVMILGGIYGGILTPTEAATFAVIYSLILTFVYKVFNWKNFITTCNKTVITSAVILFIINISNLFAFILNIENIPQIIATALMPIMVSKNLYLLILFVFLMIVGCVMDTAPAILILAPVLVPIGLQLGMTPLYLGVVFCVVLTVGMMTPPFGLTLFTMASTGNLTFEQVVKGVVPFLIASIIALLIMIYVPGAIIMIH